MTEENPPLSPNHEQPNPIHKWLMLVFKGVIIAFVVSAIAALSSPMILQSQKKSPRTEAINNAKQIGLALYAFDEEFGTYPSPSSAAAVTTAYPSHGYDLTGNSSNALFRQLFAAKLIDSEMPFYAKIMNSIMPDGIIIPREALKKGECGFAYISGHSTRNNPHTPLILAPMIPRTNKFDPEPFDGQVIVFQIDHSVKAYKIRKDGTIHDKDGDILSPKHPIWNGKTPTIHYPE